MFTLNVEKVERVAVIHCQGRIVRSDAAFRLRNAVREQRDARIVLLDLSGVQALEGGGLGMLRFLHLWARDHGIQLKVIDPIACVRRSLEHTRSTLMVHVAGFGEALSLLCRGPEEMWDVSQSIA